MFWGTSARWSLMLLSRLSRCPWLCFHPALLAQSSVLRSWRNSWWKCRRPYSILLLFSGVWSSSLTFQPQFVEFWAVFKVFHQNRVWRRNWNVPGRGDFGCLLGFSPEQGTTALRVSQEERISERIVEQFCAGGDFPSRRVLVSFSRDRVQQLLVPSRSPTLLLLEVLTFVVQDRFQRRLLDRPTSGTGVPT